MYVDDFIWYITYVNPKKKKKKKKKKKNTTYVRFMSPQFECILFQTKLKTDDKRHHSCH